MKALHRIRCACGWKGIPWEDTSPRALSAHIKLLDILKPGLMEHVKKEKWALTPNFVFNLEAVWSGHHGKGHKTVVSLDIYFEESDMEKLIGRMKSRRREE